MKKMYIKYFFILIYCITFIFVGYYSIEPNNVKLTNNLTRENITFFSLVFYNYSNIMFLIILSFIGGLFSIFSITNLLIKLGLTIHIIYLNTKINLLNIISTTMIHGIFELLALIIVLGISIDIFLIFFRYLILDSDVKLRYAIKNYILENLYNKIIYITIILLIGGILEYFVSAKIFSSLGIN